MLSEWQREYEEGCNRPLPYWRIYMRWQLQPFDVRRHYAIVIAYRYSLLQYATISIHTYRHGHATSPTLYLQIAISPKISHDDIMMLLSFRHMKVISSSPCCHYHVVERRDTHNIPHHIRAVKKAEQANCLKHVYQFTREKNNISQVWHGITHHEVSSPPKYSSFSVLFTWCQKNIDIIDEHHTRFTSYNNSHGINWYRRTLKNRQKNSQTVTSPMNRQYRSPFTKTTVTQQNG